MLLVKSPLGFIRATRLTNPLTFDGHFEQIDLWQTLSMENTILYVVISAKFLQLNHFIQWALFSIPIPKFHTRFMILNKNNVENLSINPCNFKPYSFVIFDSSLIGYKKPYFEVVNHYNIMVTIWWCFIVGLDHWKKC